MARLRALFIDLSGTLHVDATATPGAKGALERLRQAGIVLSFVSNTSKESRSSLLDKMHKMELDVREEELFTSLSAVRDIVLRRNLKPLYLLSPSALADFPPSSAPFDSVVVGLAPTTFDYSHLNEAFRLLSGETESRGKKGQIPLIVTHKARFFGDKDGKLSLGPGPFISALEEATGCQAEIVGKPSESFYQLALDSISSHGFERSEIGMIGDDVVQDVGSAVERLGLRRYLVKTGKYRPGDEDKLIDPSEVRVCENFAKAVETILSE
ncbi:uncharacterized protein JCM6883_003790 [Sporobolomyces salmoneus]|uniref:uncharacterized protein n=1 Tax=Sporobolomyces salmoneus TaxID=183962 RepID=UPI003180CCD6